ncbi:MAG: polynucleotide adenylyltransferase [Deltaproteobacteria bacterium]|nr:MAG: polynucleotide adenylyltransferase [Deltaproteobacteria bacterium]
MTSHRLPVDINSRHIVRMARLLKDSLPNPLLRALVEVAEAWQTPLYLVGGSMRDLLLGRMPRDVDIAVEKDPELSARRLIKVCDGGTLVKLGSRDQACRVVIDNVQVDFSAFRGASGEIEEDLLKRDFSINALAVDLVPLVCGLACRLLDPAGGLDDLRTGCVRHLPGSFIDDPLRLLRAYRLVAEFDFLLAVGTRTEIRRLAQTLRQPAAERVSAELYKIFASLRTSKVLKMMDEDGLLAILLSELYQGKGVQQPDSHHLDVLGHCLLALEMIEKILLAPGRFYPDDSVFVDYIKDEEKLVNLKWAALLHDLGKPETQKIWPEREGKITFYGHDKQGRALFQKYAKAWRWSQRNSERVGKLIAMHMHPFHLCNVQRQSSVSAKAVLKLVRRAGEDLPGLFLLAMADSLASQGSSKPSKMEAELVQLFTAVQRINTEKIQGLLNTPPLLTGEDLRDIFGLTPGPLFGVILDDLEVARVEGRVSDRAQALAWVSDYLRQRQEQM